MPTFPRRSLVTALLPSRGGRLCGVQFTGGTFTVREWQAWRMHRAMSQALGAVPSSLPQQGGPQLPASMYRSTAQHRSCTRAWPLLPFDEHRWKAEASDLHNDLLCPTPPPPCLHLVHHQAVSQPALSLSLPLLVPLRHYSSKVLKSKPGNLSGWQAQVPGGLRKGGIRQQPQGLKQTRYLTVSYL
jgi:hypothetical protein